MEKKTLFNRIVKASDDAKKAITKIESDYAKYLTGKTIQAVEGEEGDQHLTVGKVLRAFVRYTTPSRLEVTNESQVKPYVEIEVTTSSNPQLRPIGSTVIIHGDFEVVTK